MKTCSLLLLLGLMSCNASFVPTLAEPTERPSFYTKHGIAVYDLVYSGITVTDVEFLVDMIAHHLKLPTKHLNDVHVFLVPELRENGAAISGTYIARSHEIYVTSAMGLDCHPATGLVHYLVHMFLHKEHGADDVSHMHPTAWDMSGKLQMMGIVARCDQRWIESMASPSGTHYKMETM